MAQQIQSQQVQERIEGEGEASVVAIGEAIISTGTKIMAGVEDTAVEAEEEEEEGTTTSSALWTGLQNLSYLQYHRDQVSPIEAPSGVA